MEDGTVIEFMANWSSAWITPQGDVIGVGGAERSHETVAANYGLSQIGAVREGWIRVYGDAYERLYFELWDARNETTLSLIEEYLFLKWYPRVSRKEVVGFEVHRPVGGYIHFTKADLEGVNLRDLLEDLLRAEAIRQKSRGWSA